MRAIKKIKVIGFPFAKSQVGIGAARTPDWLTSQQWFDRLTRLPKAGVEYETVPVKQIERLNTPQPEADHSQAALRKDEVQTILANCQ